MFFRKKQFQKRILFNAPGPSPWYLLKSSAIRTTRGQFHWEGCAEDKDLCELTRLVSPSRDTVLLLGFYFYVKALGDGKILVWHEKTTTCRDIMGGAEIAFYMLDLYQLCGFKDFRKAATRLTEQKQKILFENGLITEFTFLNSVDEGIYPLDLPEEFARLNEVLVLADYRPRKEEDNPCDKMHRAIFAFNFQDAQAEVIPQDWFNNGNYDFGYQWITRVIRHPGSNRIIGEGIRLGIFVLDETGKQIDTWLQQDPGYHPGY